MFIISSGDILWSFMILSPGGWWQRVGHGNNVDLALQIVLKQSDPLCESFSLDGPHIIMNNNRIALQRDQSGWIINLS